MKLHPGAACSNVLGVYFAKCLNKQRTLRDALYSSLKSNITEYGKPFGLLVLPLILRNEAHHLSTFKPWVDLDLISPACHGMDPIYVSSFNLLVLPAFIHHFQFL